MRKILSTVSIFLLCTIAHAEDYAWKNDLEESRKRLLKAALSLHESHPTIPYKVASADETGMDCSGAVTWMMKNEPIEFPRSSQGQFDFLMKQNKITRVPLDATATSDEVFQKLQPGDFIFWGDRAAAKEGKFVITHVHMYLGKEHDGLAVMIGSSEGRSYRGKKINGFGIVDFTVPKIDNPKAIIGFGFPE